MKYNSFAQSVLRRIAAICMACTLFGLYLLPVQSASAQGIAYIRVIHASPFVGTADVFVDGAKLLSSFQFASVTDYVHVPDGVHKVQIALVGKGINAAVLSQDLPVQAGYSYTVAALGATANSLSLKVFVDDNQVDANRSKVRIYHLAPNAGSVNVNVGGDQQINNVLYPTASNYLTTDSGPCNFSLSDAQFNATLPLSADLSPNMVTSIFAVGLFSGQPQIQLVSAQTPGLPSLPSTGSNPSVNPLDSVTADPLAIWLLALGALALIGMSFAARLKWRKA